MSQLVLYNELAGAAFLLPVPDSAVTGLIPGILKIISEEIIVNIVKVNQQCSW